MIKLRVVLVALLLLCPVVQAGELDLMTQNQYLGADLSGVLAAAAAQPFDPVAFNAAVVSALQQIAANRTEERISAQVAMIEKRQPHFVGLQEVFRFDCFDPNGTDACNDPTVAGAFTDFRERTVSRLGSAYDDVAAVRNLYVPGIPFQLPGYADPAYFAVTDRDVILARSDLGATPVDFGCTGFESLEGCNYQVALPAGPFVVWRGYVGVDATVDGHDYRIVTTHFEVKDPPVPAIIQSLQAQELLGVLGASPPETHVVVLGDINSSPADPVASPYSQFAALGYTDAWTLRPGNVGGASCCQRADLANQKSVLDQRIDMVFTNAPPAAAKRVRLLGDKVSTRTAPPGRGLWASDHAAVAAELEFFD